MIIRKYAYPRAALIGNPSDGYHGKTIAFTFRNFRAEAVLYESPELEIIPCTRDHSRFSDINHLVQDVEKFGYYGGIRLLKAAVKRFHDHCRDHGLRLPDRNFTLRYHTTIPPHLGLAGSSAIITSSMRALMDFYDVTIEKPVLANLILSVETDELGIPAGLQDRVAQVYDTPVYMDFSRELMARQGYGSYEPLDPALLPRLYVAYRTELSQGSEVTHSTLRYRYQQQDPDVLAAIKLWTELTERARECLLRGNTAALGPLLNENFDMRAKVCEISEGNRCMVETARRTGASAKFTGSGGAIIGTYEDDSMFARLEKALAEIGVSVLKPEL